MLFALALRLADEYAAISLAVYSTIDVEDNSHSKAEEYAGDILTDRKYTLPLIIWLCSLTLGLLFPELGSIWQCRWLCRHLDKRFKMMQVRLSAFAMSVSVLQSITPIVLC